MDVPLETGSRGSVPLCIAQDESKERPCPCNAVSCFCVHFFLKKNVFVYEFEILVEAILLYFAC
jgi:hypothetical protein